MFENVCINQNKIVSFVGMAEIKEIAIDWMQTADRIKEEMEQQGMNAFGFSKKLEVSPSTVTRFFNHTTCVNHELITKMCNLLDLKLLFYK